MRLPTAALALCLLPQLAVAETPMTGAEFEAYVRNKTISYDYGDGFIGIEQYLPGLKVRWKPDPETCILGRWYDQQDQICFVYDRDPTPQCWLFFDDDAALRARYMSGGAGEGWEIRESDKSDGPLSCAGPEIGV